MFASGRKQPYAVWQHPLSQRLFLGWLLLVFWGYLLLAYPLFALLLHLPARWRWTRNAAHHLNTTWGMFLMIAWGSLPHVRWRSSLPDGPCIYVANHRSYLDIAAVHVALRRQFRFLGKAELNRIPLFGMPYRRLQLTFDRADSRQAARALLQAERLLRDGTSVFLFPEGSTHANGGALLGRFKDGAFQLAVRSGCPVVPVALTGTDHALSNDGQFWTRPARITVAVGTAISPAGRDAATVSALARQAVIDLLSLPEPPTTTPAPESLQWLPT